jgi:hypothetical protein
MTASGMLHRVVRRTRIDAARENSRHTMEANDTYPFTFEAVREKAPNASGVYRLHTPHRWVYIGESEDIQESLFRHLNEPSESMTRFGPLSFSLELVPAGERHALQEGLIAELEPACTTAH